MFQKTRKEEENKAPDCLIQLVHPLPSSPPPPDEHSSQCILPQAACGRHVDLWKPGVINNFKGTKAAKLGPSTSLCHD